MASNARADEGGVSMTERIELDGTRTNAGATLRVTQSMVEPMASGQ